MSQSDAVLITDPFFQRVPVTSLLITPTGQSQTSVGAQLGNPTFGNVALTGTLTVSATNGITAHAGGGRTSAVALTTVINRLGTVATAADSVVLPVAAPGLVLIVSNSTGTSAQVFALGSDTIDGTAGATGVALAGGKTALFSSAVAGVWHMLLSA
jgi:hypothetical protein